MSGESSVMKNIAMALIVVGGGLSVAGYLSNGDRFSYAYLLAFVFVWAVVLGSLFFVSLHHITRAVWSVVVRRVAEMFAAPVWLIALLFVPVLVFLYMNTEFSLYSWANPEVMHGDHVLEGKAPYLNTTFFLIRAAVFFLIWIAFARFYVNGSLRQDSGEAGGELTKKMRARSGPFILIFALTVTFASFDWLMSLEPHWFSTIFGVYTFAGMVISSLSAITLTVVWLRAKGRLGNGVVTDDHLYSLGALLFAFTCFWAYIAFSQFMLIWYGNMPEETVYFQHRVEHGWLAVSLVLVVLRFVVPFFLLLSRPSKMNPRTLVAASILGLAGELVDLYWLIMPQYHTDGPRLSWQAPGPLLLLVGILLLYFARFLNRNKTLPEGDPLYKESLEFHL
jgi:hypothetical protein